MYIRHKLSHEGKIHLRERGARARPVEMLDGLLNTSDRTEVAAYFGVSPATVHHAIDGLFKAARVKNFHDLLIYLLPYIEVGMTEPVEHVSYPVFIDNGQELPLLPIGKKNEN